MKRLVIVLTLLVGLSAFAFGVWQWSLPKLPAGLTRQQYRQAAAQFRSRYSRSPDYFDTISWLAESSLAKDDLDTALAGFRAIPSAHPLYGHSSRFLQGQVLVKLNRAREAEENLKEFLELESADQQWPTEHLIDARQRLRYLLEIQLRFEERRELLREMVLNDQGDSFDVMVYCFPTILRWNGPDTIAWLEGFLKEDPENFQLRVALGRYRTGQGRLEEAQEILLRCRREQPKNLRAAAAFIACLRELDNWEAIDREFAELPSATENDPWLLLRLRGHWHHRRKEFSEAVLCFQLALRSDPANSESYLGLGRAYAALNEPEQQQKMIVKSQVLGRIQNRLGWGQSSPEDLDPFIEIAELCEEIELFEQALVIVRLARRFDPANKAVRAIQSRLEARK